MKNRMKKITLLSALVLLAPVPVQAQEAVVPVETPPVAETPVATAPAETQPVVVPAVPVITPTGALNPVELQSLNEMSSLVFTYWEYTAIEDAKRSRGNVRPPTEDELTRDLNKGPQTEKVKPPPEERDISLGGIVYVDGSDWTIWLNDQRITPDAIPPEVIDLRVYKDHIDLKWLDDYTNQIFPIRLRAHQRFNIDTRIFLPG
jgi:hypothetical protein